MIKLTKFVFILGILASMLPHNSHCFLVNFDPLKQAVAEIKPVIENLNKTVDVVAGNSLLMKDNFKDAVAHIAVVTVGALLAYKSAQWLCVSLQAIRDKLYPEQGNRKQLNAFDYCAPLAALMSIGCGMMMMRGRLPVMH